MLQAKALTFEHTYGRYADMAYPKRVIAEETSMSSGSQSAVLDVSHVRS